MRLPTGSCARPDRIDLVRAVAPDASTARATVSCARTSWLTMLPVAQRHQVGGGEPCRPPAAVHMETQEEAPCAGFVSRSEEHTSELQSPYDIVCRLLLEK